jgi:hypothetical protein
MHGRYFTNSCRPALLGLAAILSSAVADSALARDRGPHKEDSRTCASFGASHGSPEYSRCMLQQQRRRDNAPLIAAEAQRNNAEAAQRNLQTVRRMKCEREAKRERERGERPRWCD